MDKIFFFSCKKFEPASASEVNSLFEDAAPLAMMNAWLGLPPAEAEAEDASATPLPPPAKRAKRTSYGWSDKLEEYVDWPEHPHVQAATVERDDCSVTIVDKYGKSTIHLLVIPLEKVRCIPLVLDASRLPLLRALLARGRALVSSRGGRVLASDEKPAAGDPREAEEGGTSASSSAAAAPAAPTVIDFRIGFHAMPSMSQLHLHVISQDFHSAALKNKKHWNSFTSSFFVPVQHAIARLERGESVAFDLAAAKALTKAPLCCHRCGADMKNMPTLKAHILTCDAPVAPTHASEYPWATM